MVFHVKERKLFAVDLDGTLTNGEEYWNGKRITPNKKAIKWINEKYLEGHIVIIYTARPYEDLRKTIAWLIANGVLYHGINMDKMAGDIYIDDKCVNVKNLQNKTFINKIMLKDK